MRAADFDWTERCLRERLPQIMTGPRTEAEVVEMLMPMVAPGVALRCGQSLRATRRLSQDDLIEAGREHIVRLLLPRLTSKHGKGLLHVHPAVSAPPERQSLVLRRARPSGA